MYFNYFHIYLFIYLYFKPIFNLTYIVIIFNAGVMSNDLTDEIESKCKYKTPRE